jgi:hypothetical protein
MKTIHMYGIALALACFGLVVFVFFSIIWYIGMFLLASGALFVIAGLWRFTMPAVEKTITTRLETSREQHRQEIAWENLELQKRVLAHAERHKGSVKLDGNGTIEVLVSSHVQVVEEKQEQMQLAAPQVQQPSMDEMYNAVPYNSLQVAFGKTMEKGEIVTVPIIGGVHFKLVGGSGFGKSCLAGALLDIATKRNDPDHLRIALLDLEYKTSRLFEELPHVMEVGGQRRRRLIAKDADEVAAHLGYLKKELDRRASQQVAMPLLLIYVEEMLSLQYEVDEKLKAQMLADLAILALRGRKYGMFLMACTQTDYSTKELKEAQKQFRTRSGFAIDPSAARAAGFVNTELVNYNYRNAKPGQFLLERPAFSSLVLAPLYDVEQKLVELSNPSRRYYAASRSASPQYYSDDSEVDYEADTEKLEVTGEVVDASPLHMASQASLTPQEWRIVRKWKKGDSVSQIIEEEYGIKGGAAFTRKAREIQTLIGQFLPNYAIEQEA